MLEHELTSELLIVGIAGMQDKKKSIDIFYEKYEDEYPSETRDAKHFDETMSTISETFRDDLEETSFKRPPLFYTLYCVIYHRMFGMIGIQRQSPRRSLSSADRSKLRDATMKLSDVILQAKTRKSRYIRNTHLCYSLFKANR